MVWVFRNFVFIYDWFNCLFNNCLLSTNGEAVKRWVSKTPSGYVGMHMCEKLIVQYCTVKRNKLKKPADDPWTGGQTNDYPIKNWVPAGDCWAIYEFNQQVSNISDLWGSWIFSDTDDSITGGDHLESNIHCQSKAITYSWAPLPNLWIWAPDFCLSGRDHTRSCPEQPRNGPLQAHACRASWCLAPMLLHACYQPSKW